MVILELKMFVGSALLGLYVVYWVHEVFTIFYGFLSISMFLVFFWYLP